MKNWCVCRPNSIAFSLLAFFLLLCGAKAQSGVPDAAGEICPLLPGAEAPALSLVNVEGEKFELSSEQPVVMIFYKGGW